MIGTGGVMLALLGAPAAALPVLLVGLSHTAMAVLGAVVAARTAVRQAAD
jgi:hypothetical protein